MWNLSDVVIYGSAGVCRIDDIKSENFAGEMKTYFILKPVFDTKTTIHVPEFNEKLMAKIKSVLQRDEALCLIKNFQHIAPLQIDNDKIRYEKYKEILDSGDREMLLAVIKALYERREQLNKSNKKMRASDEHTLKDAEQLFENELSYIFSIPREEVREFIKSQSNQ